MSEGERPSHPGSPGSGRESSGGGEPERRSFGLRIALYLLTVYFCYIFGTGLILLLTEGQEKLEALWQASTATGTQSGNGEPGEAGGQPTLPFLLGLKAQLLLLPVLLAVTGVFAASDRRTLADLGIAWPSRRVVGPVAQTFGVVAAVVAVLGAWRLVAEQWITFTVQDAFPAEQVESLGRWLPLDVTGLVLFGLAFVALGFLDEVIFRGYVYAVLLDRLPWIHAAGLSALVFALFRPGDPTVLAPSLLNVFLLGLLLAGLRQASGSLLLGSLFHGLWNLFLGCILSLPVSGLWMPRREPLRMDGPLWATGGDYGPEGSWLLTGLLLLAVLGVTAWVEAGEESSEESSDEGSDESSDGDGDEDEAEDRDEPSAAEEPPNRAG